MIELSIIDGPIIEIGTQNPKSFHPDYPMVQYDRMASLLLCVIQKGS